MRPTSFYAAAHRLALESAPCATTTFPDPPESDRLYANYLETCRRAGVEPAPSERAQEFNRGMVGRDCDIERTRQLAIAMQTRFSPTEPSSKRVVSTRALSLPGAFGMLLSIAATAQGLIASDQPPSEVGPPIGPTTFQIVPYLHGMYALPDFAPAVPSCYRIGRCSAYDLNRFRDRPNRLTRLAPEAPPESGAEAAWIPYRWLIVPATPEENILPQYRAASQVREEYRGVGIPVDSPN